MNIILLFENDFIDQDHVALDDHRYDHIINVHKKTVGDSVLLGQLNGNIGQGLITQIIDKRITLAVELSHKPPQKLPITLIIALPRPKMIKRILQTCATMGVKKIIFINSYRVEKSYWQSPLLSSESIKEQLILGLEQAKDTVLPEVLLEKRFKPFVEDTLPSITEGSLALVAHPNSTTPCPTTLNRQVTLLVGPEGGFIPYEIEKLNEAGCESIHLGERILRVETAIPVLLAKLF